MLRSIIRISCIAGYKVESAHVMSSWWSLVGLAVLLLLLSLWAAEEEDQETSQDEYSIDLH